jgi:hypothetical protein
MTLTHPHDVSALEASGLGFGLELVQDFGVGLGSGLGGWGLG